MVVNNSANHPGIVARLFGANFRCYKSFDVELSPGFNLVTGPNAQGKTTILEAVYFLSTARLLRTSRDHEAIRHDEAGCRVGVELAGSGTILEIKLERGGRKKAFLNGLPLKRAADLIGRCPTTSISILDLELATGEPAARRLWMDYELSQLYAGYLVALTHYKRALDQRNALLRSEIPPSPDSYEPWEAALAEHGSAMRQYRSDYFEAVSGLLERVHPFLACNETLGAKYEPKDENFDPDSLACALAACRYSDLARGSTTVGPHRDDVVLMVNGTQLRAFGSQGQQRTSVISLKLAGMLLMRERLGATPLLLLDDILSDLDEGRRRRLVEWVLQEAEQAVLTCTEPAAAGNDLVSRAKVFHIESGEIRAT